MSVVHDGLKESRIHSNTSGCFKCGNQDPAHVGRKRKRSRGVNRPALVRDTMLCLNCGATWRETV